MPRFSLIVGTIERIDELSVLLHSLSEQRLYDFELIIVDQNSDDRLSPLLHQWGKLEEIEAAKHGTTVRMKYLRCPRGVSRARNFGLLHSSGDIIGFPDDDCWYLPDTLESVDSWFRHHPDYGILSIGCRDSQGRRSGNHWWQSECDLKPINIFRTSGTCTFFVRRPPAGIPLLFDESLGPGAETMFGAAEDTDFLLTLMSFGIRGRFNSSLHVCHPCRDGFVDVQRAKTYGGGFGRVLAKHSLPLLWLGFVAYDFSRAGLRMILGDRRRASQLSSHGQGMIRAYFSR
jgi:glycosyltransferase involved in cell wall biosynthesis